jgi:S-adenosylmethionine hydrolase
VSRTFHGRDVFAPAAAYLAAGVPPTPRRGGGGPGSRAHPGSRLEATRWSARCAVDRFSLLTSIEAGRLAALAGDGPVAVEVSGRPVAGIVEAYADGSDGRPAAIIGSTGRFEIFVRGGSAHQMLGAGRGAPVRIRKRA